MTSVARLQTEAASAQPVDAAATRLVATRTAIVVAVLALVALALPRVLSTLDFFHVQTVQLEGARFVSPTAVISALGADTTASVFDNPARFVAKVESIPLVSSATVKRRLPGTLVVTIVERIPVALVPTSQGFRGVDSAGRRLPTDLAVAAFDAPVVLPAAGARDTVADRALFNLLGTIRAKNPTLFDTIEEARRVSANEWHLRTTRQLVRVMPEVTLARLADIFPVERDLARRRIRAVELDLRFNNLVIARLP
jgi:cell division protein FtsQ